jgi:hypothetical protein
MIANQFSNRQQIRKPAVVSKGGIVAAQSRKAAEIGAEVLASGGDCIDAVIATGFAMGIRFGAYAIASRERARHNSPSMMAMLSAFQASPLVKAAA